MNVKRSFLECCLLWTDGYRAGPAGGLDATALPQEAQQWRLASLQRLSITAAPPSGLQVSFPAPKAPREVIEGILGTLNSKELKSEKGGPWADLEGRGSRGS